MEVAGHITPNWALSGGYTKISLKNETTGEQGRTFIPRQTFKASTTYTVPDLHNFSIGGEMRWQSHIATTVTAFAPTKIRQGSYAIVDLMAGVDIVKNLRATVNVRNITNKLYLTSLAYGDSALGLYGAGRNFTASLAYRF